MPRKDRGPSFGGYYIVDPSTPQRLLGARFENSWPCGSFTVNGVAKGITFFHFLKDLDADATDDPEHAETFDVGVSCYDGYKENPGHILNKLMKGEDITPSLADLKPVPKELIDKDLKEGKGNEEIVETRAGILVGEFLGFTLADVIRDFPGVWQPTIVDGQEVPNIWPCSLEEA